MQLWFQALFGISNARTLRLDDFFPSDHGLRMIHLPHQKYGTQTTQKILLEEYSFILQLLQVG